MSPSHRYGSLVNASMTKPAFLNTSGRLFTCSSQFCPLISKISDGFSHLPPTKQIKTLSEILEQTSYLKKGSGENWEPCGRVGRAKAQTQKDWRRSHAHRLLCIRAGRWPQAARTQRSSPAAAMAFRPTPCLRLMGDRSWV